jgi:hypothetical protein
MRYGRRLAVQTGPTVRVGAPDGRRDAVVPLPVDTGLVTDVAWSPDGRLLAVEGWAETGTDGRSPTARPRSPSSTRPGRAGPVPAPVVAEQMLGRCGDRVVAYIPEADGAAITEIPLGAGLIVLLACRRLRRRRATAHTSGRPAGRPCRAAANRPRMPRRPGR